jgi:hypothetical protein
MFVGVPFILDNRLRLRRVTRMAYRPDTCGNEIQPKDNVTRVTDLGVNHGGPHRQRDSAVWLRTSVSDAYLTLAEAPTSYPV